MTQMFNIDMGNDDDLGPTHRFEDDNDESPDLAGCRGHVQRKWQRRKRVSVLCSAVVQHQLLNRFEQACRSSIVTGK